MNDLRTVRNTVGSFIIQVSKFEIILNNITCLTDFLFPKLAYGIDVLPENDLYVELADRTMHSVTRVVVPGTYMVDILPICKDCVKSISWT